MRILHGKITRNLFRQFFLLCFPAFLMCVDTISAQEHFMPLELGRQWIYNYRFETENVSGPMGDITQQNLEYRKVSSLDSINGIYAHRINTWQEDSSWVASEWYVQNDSGLFTVAYSYWYEPSKLSRSRSRLSFHDQTFSSFQELCQFLLHSSIHDTIFYKPARKLLKYPLVEDSSWVWFNDPWYATRTAEENEIIETSSGLFDCIRIRIDYDIDADGEIDNDIIFREWWSLNVGLVVRDITIYDLVETDEQGDSIGVHDARMNWELIGNDILQTEIEPALLQESPEIHSAYPNPFNPTTTIKFSMPTSGSVTLTVHDLSGREVSVLVNSWHEAGKHSVQWDATNVASGVYFLRMQSDDFSQVRKVTVLR